MGTVHYTCTYIQHSVKNCTYYVSVSIKLSLNMRGREFGITMQ